MAVLIPSLTKSKRSLTSGERRFAERLEEKLEDDYLIWFDVPVGPRGLHPDFIILHPRRGILILEVKDWHLDTIQSIDKVHATILGNQGVQQVKNPLEQAREYAHAVADLLKRDPTLVARHESPLLGKLLFPWSYGVVLSNITRAQFEAAELGSVMQPDRVICKDEMLQDVDAEAFQQRLWSMFPWPLLQPLSLPQIDRVRWHLFPEIRIRQTELFADDLAKALPDLLHIMDLQQERLARGLGEGHRVIHGVAGSGKTMILGFRCQMLARAMNRPILVLCYNVVLASHLEALMREKGIAGHVAVRSFHAWCREQLQTYHVPLPPSGEGFFKDLVQAVIDAVDRGQIPAGQYGAVLVDEGHDFEPAWLRLVAQMVAPETNALLLLYDDAQAIYAAGRSGRFSFKSVGIQAQGRTTILRLNYRNTAEILRVAYAFAKDVLCPEDTDDDSAPLLLPQSAERHGPKPELICLKNLEEEAACIAGRFRQRHASGVPWRDMAVVYRSRFMGAAVTSRLQADGIPVAWLRKDERHQRRDAQDDVVTVVTFHSSKGLEFPVVAIPGVGFLPFAPQDEEIRLMYVAMTRATHELWLTCHRASAFVDRLRSTEQQDAWRVTAPG